MDDIKTATNDDKDLIKTVNDLNERMSRIHKRFDELRRERHAMYMDELIFGISDSEDESD